MSRTTPADQLTETTPNHEIEQSQQKAPQRPGFPFLALPREIRDEIYNYALVPDYEILLDPTGNILRRAPSRSPTSDSPLLLLCKQIHFEAQAILSNLNAITYLIRSPSDYQVFQDLLMREPGIAGYTFKPRTPKRLYVLVPDPLYRLWEKVYYPSMVTLVPTTTADTEHDQFVIYMISQPYGRLLLYADFTSEFPSLPLAPGDGGDEMWKEVTRTITPTTQYIRTSEKVRGPLRMEWMYWAEFRQRKKERRIWKEIRGGVDG